MVVVVRGGGEEKRKGCMKKTHRVYTGLYTPSKTKKNQRILRLQNSGGKAKTCNPHLHGRIREQLKGRATVIESGLRGDRIRRRQSQSQSQSQSPGPRDWVDTNL